MQQKKLIIPIKLKTKKIVPIFLPNYGCKHRCVFCNEFIATDQIKPISIKDSLKFYKVRGEGFQIAFYGGSFTALPMDIQRDFLSKANEYTNDIRISTIPDEINHKELDFLMRYNVRAIEIGVQSFDDEVLEFAKRPHNSKQAIEAARLIKSYGLELGIHLMVGLPKDSERKDLSSAKMVVDLQSDTCRIAPTLVFKNTVLEKLYNQGDYVPMSLDKAVDIVSKMSYILIKSGVKINRFGLHISESMRKGGVVAGPIHESFGDIVYSEMIYKQIDPSYDYIESSPKYKNYLIGYKGMNKDRIKLPIKYFDNLSCIKLVKL